MELLEKNQTLKWCTASYYQSRQGRRKAIGDSPAVLKLLGGKNYFDNYFSAVTAGGTILIMTSTMLVRKSTFDKLGVFDSCWQRARRPGYVVADRAHVSANRFRRAAFVNHASGRTIRRQ